MSEPETRFHVFHQFPKTLLEEKEKMHLERSNLS